MPIVLGPVVESINLQARATAVLSVLQNEVCFCFVLLETMMCKNHGNSKIIL